MFGDWENVGAPQQDPVTDEWEQLQKRTVTFEKEMMDSTGNVQENVWVEDSRTETQYVDADAPSRPTPTPTPTPDPNPPPPPPDPPPPPPKPEPDPPPPPVETWGPWVDVRIVWLSYTNWVNTNQTRGSLGNRERKQTREVRREQIQRKHLKSWQYPRPESIPIAPFTQERWVSDPEPEVWGEWKDTGRTRDEGQFGIIEKEQKRTSNYGNTQTRWVAA